MTRAVPATVLADEAWLREDLALAARLYGRASARVLGTVRWYSASSVLVAPSMESLVHTGTALDPALEEVTFQLHPDGRYVDAHARRMLGADVAALGSALGTALAPVVEAIASVSGATPASLWAVAGDSIANRMLWAASALGDAERGVRLASELASAPELRVPTPRFVRVGGRPVVRRASCCLVYEATGGEKCASCPRQTPDERTRRLRALLGP